MLQVEGIRRGGAVLLAALLLGGCGYRYKEIDEDGDGYLPNGDEPDCWDAKDGPEGSGFTGADIHPGASDDFYDGVDSNCDGADDFDQDGDGYRLEVDCDDTAAGVNPDAAEACTDGVDNDCDGLTDTDDLNDGDNTQDSFENTPFYLDVDGDRYGDANSGQVYQESCTAPAGYSVLGGDCDDGDASVSPAAQEVCDADEVDEDCDGAADELDPEGAVGGDDYHPDADGDSYGDASSTVQRCAEGDGYLVDASDCDDGDPDIHPGAQEVCDDADTDEDCDGGADDADPDEDAEGGETYYLDSDGDGYGSDLLSAAVTRCDGAGDLATNNDDCEDGDAAIHPGATEVCDDANEDEDCDGDRDDEDPSVDLSGAEPWYADEDGDGFGDAGAGPVTACDQPDDTVADGEDCDDGDATIYPGADETCGDGESSDCDVDPLDARLACQDPADVTAANAHLSTTAKSALAGSAVSGGGDVDGDGSADLIAGAPGYSTNKGRVYLASGALDPDSTSLDSDSLAYFTSSATGEALGTAVAGGGDADGDGYADLLMTAPGEDSGASNAGVAWLVLGPVSSKGTVDSAADSALLGDTADLGLGTAALLADVTGDDVADVVVSATEYDVTGKSNVGAVFVLEGPTAGSVASGSADYLFTGDNKNGDNAGSALAAPGDMDGDGQADLAVGVSGNNDAATDAGKVWLLWGPVIGSGSLPTEADYTVKGIAANDLAGSTLAPAGDVDGDGYADLWVGAPGASSGAGAAYLVMGDLYLTGSLSLSSAVATLTGGTAASAGDALAGVDLDLDGTPDAVVGAPTADHGSSADAGAVYGVYGPFSGTKALSSADVVLYGDAAGDGLGSAAANVGDSDGDGDDDLLLGAPTYDYTTSETDAGAVYLFSSWY